MFQDTASANAPTQTNLGRQSRRDSVSTARGAATNLRRAMFSPTGEGTANAALQATRYTTNSHRSSRARATRQHMAIPIRQKAAAAANSAVENGKVPCAGNIRCSTTSAVPIAATAAAGATNEAASRRRARATPAKTTTSKRNASGLAARVPSAPAAKAARRRRCNAESATSARALPSMKGYAPERTSTAHTRANALIDHLLCSPHSCLTTAAKATTEVATVSTARSLMPTTAASG